MISNKRVKYQDCSDRQLIDLFGQSGDRQGLVELYERYRVSVGNYLYQEIKNKKTVLNIFNTMMMDLVRKPSFQNCGSSVAVKLFSMAYKRRIEYVENEAQKSRVQLATKRAHSNNESQNKLPALSRLQKDVVELVYNNNFAVDEVADIVDRTPSVITNCLTGIRNQHPYSDGSNSSAMRI